MKTAAVVAAFIAIAAVLFAVEVGMIMLVSVVGSFFRRSAAE